MSGWMYFENMELARKYADENGLKIDNSMYNGRELLVRFKGLTNEERKALREKQKENNSVEEKEEYIVYAQSGSSTMYVKEKKNKNDKYTTYYWQEAKKFTKSKAMGMAAGMSKRGSLQWYYKKI